MLPSAYGLGQYFQDLSHSFSPYGPPSRQITYIYALDKFYRLPPDKENPAYIQQFQEIDTNLSHNMNELAP